MIKPEETMPEGDKSQEDRLRHEWAEKEANNKTETPDLDDKVDAENEPRTCPHCGKEIKVKTENYEFNDGMAGDYDYESGHDPACVNYKKQIN